MITESATLDVPICKVLPVTVSMLMEKPATISFYVLVTLMISEDVPKPNTPWIPYLFQFDSELSVDYII